MKNLVSLFGAWLLCVGLVGCAGISVQQAGAPVHRAGQVLATSAPLPSNEQISPEPGAAWRPEVNPSAAPNMWEEPADLWTHMRRGFVLPPLESPLVANHVQRFKETDYFGKCAARIRPFLPVVVQAIDERRLPLELALVPLVESALNCNAKSVVAATGCWQFMHATAKDQRLMVSALVVQEGIKAIPILLASLLHDSVEDNPGERGQWIQLEIKNTLGSQVFDLVDALTDVAPRDFPRAKRKALQMERMAIAPWEVKVIKLADVVASMQEGPAPNWSTQYASEYVKQRSHLVFQVLRSSSESLFQAYSEALLQPVWHSAIAMQSQDGTGGWS